MQFYVTGKHIIHNYTAVLWINHTPIKPNDVLLDKYWHPYSAYNEAVVIQWEVVMVPAVCTVNHILKNPARHELFVKNNHNISPPAFMTGLEICAVDT